jgi:hypothetical protein
MGGMPQDDYPRSMRDPSVQQRRQALLRESHISPLASYVASLREQHRGEVPDFDPLDGGIEARVLFLFEKPGPMTAFATGSGFISRNNDDRSAEATWNFMRLAGIPRTATITWNLIPWWNGVRKVTPGEVRDGLNCLADLTRLLPELRAVMLVGRNAEKATGFVETLGLSVFSSLHPSPLVKARFPSRWREIPSEWAKVKDFC